MKTIVVACLVILMVSVEVFTQKQKPWTEWSKKEVEKTLNDSAWGQTQTEGESSSTTNSSNAITQVAAPNAANRDLNRSGESGEAKPSSVVKYRVRFLSAKPVRAAFARMVLLSKDQPDENLTAQLQGFVDRSFTDYIVMSVGVEVGNKAMVTAIMQAFATASKESLEKTVYLERKDGKKLFLMDYRAPVEDGMGAKFIFQRVVDGQPFLTENDTVRFVAQMNEKMKLNAKYKLSDMLYEGKLEY